MKLYGYLLMGAMGYAIGAKTGMMRKCACRSMKKIGRVMTRKLGL